MPTNKAKKKKAIKKVAAKIKRKKTAPKKGPKKSHDNKNGIKWYQLGNIKHIAGWVLLSLSLLFGLGLGGKNVPYYLKKIPRQIKNLKEKKAEKIPPFKLNLRVLRLAEKHIKNGEAIFYFMPKYIRPQKKRMDQRIIYLNYAFPDSLIYYRKNSDLKNVRWIINQDGIDILVKKALREHGLLYRFRVVRRSKRFIIRKRR